jgi:hypothetical protein
MVAAFYKEVVFAPGPNYAIRLRPGLPAAPGGAT